MMYGDLGAKVLRRSVPRREAPCMHAIMPECELRPTSQANGDGRRINRIVETEPRVLKLYAGRTRHDLPTWSDSVESNF